MAVPCCKGASLLLVVACVLALLYSIQSDIDVHCLMPQVVGTWRFYIGEPELRDIPKDQPLKNFLRCDRSEEIPLSTFTKVLEIELSSPNRAKVLSSTSEDFNTKQQNNWWTMVYDQGFEVRLQNEQLRFFSFHQYNETKDKSLVTSYCNETSMGWYRDETIGGHGCFFAFKMNTKPGDVKTTIPVNTYLKMNTAKEMSRIGRKHRNNHQLVDEINRARKMKQTTWEAQSYSFFENLSEDEFENMMGTKRGNEANLFNDQFSAESVSMLSDNDADAEDSNYGLPKNFDWRNVSGVNYMGPVRNQGACGSCYTFATLGSIEARIRIMTNNTKQITLSPQEIMSCSEYSQKCHGGFPFLAGKYIHDYSIVTEECFPYQASGVVSCDAKCKNPTQRVKLSNYRYVGGFYGAGNEKNMMEELYRRGPFVVSFVIYPDFHYYKRGVYQHVKGIAGQRLTSFRQINPWEPTSHSVLLVGWGFDEETKTKYWIIRNSWGPQWAMDGYFFLRRGVDESSIESEPVAFDPILLE